jgi:NHS family xanthosine MFS transporter
MNIKFRLIVMNFMQFFIWGAWLLTIGAYWFQNKQWSGAHLVQFSQLWVSRPYLCRQLPVL